MAASYLILSVNINVESRSRGSSYRGCFSF